MARGALKRRISVVLPGWRCRVPSFPGQLPTMEWSRYLLNSALRSSLVLHLVSITESRCHLFRFRKPARPAQLPAHPSSVASYLLQFLGRSRSPACDIDDPGTRRKACAPMPSVSLANAAGGTAK